jgi:hypothetical protein
MSSNVEVIDMKQMILIIALYLAGMGFCLTIVVRGIILDPLAGTIGVVMALLFCFLLNPWIAGKLRPPKEKDA